MRRKALAAFLLLVPAAAQARVRTGLDVLADGDFKQIQGRRVVLITNQTGINSAGVSAVDLFSKAPDVTLLAILSPEHGFRGTAEHGAAVSNSSDSATGLPVYSLYGATTRPTDAMLKGADTIVFDIQDIGTRFYTYIATMGQALEEAAHRKMRFVVLDRPNPIRGDVVEGDILDPDIKRMTGYFLIPVRHGFTVGELAHWMNETQHLGADLTIVRMRNWHREDWFDATSLTFVPPSPNIPDPTAALLYSGIGCFEATNMAVGRGTDEPFRLFGAPWLDANGLTAYLRQLNLKGILFETADFVPTKDIYARQTCHGVRLIVTDRNAVSPLEIFAASFLWIIRTQPKEFKPVWEEVRVVTGSERLHEAADGGWRLDDLLAYYRQRADEFKRAASPFHLY